MLMPKNRKTSLDIFQIIQKAYLFWEMRRKMSTMFKANKLCSVQLVQIWPYFTRQSIFNERKESFRFLNIIISIWTYKTTSEIIFHTINQFIQLRWRQLFWCVAERNLHFASRRTKFTSCYSLQAWKETKKHVLKTRKYMLVKIKLSKLLLLWKKNMLWWKSARQLFLKWRTNSLFTYSVQKPSTAFRHKTLYFFPCGVRYA